MWWKRSLRSLRRRGFVGSVDRALSVLQERLFDFRYGTDTVSFVDLKSLTIDSQHMAEGGGYQPTRLRLVRQVLSTLNPPPGSAFVDFGCGKGRVLLLAADYGFRRITGVEFAAELCDIARENIARYEKIRNVHADIRIVADDAVEYTIQDDENYFFMFNPFSGALIAEVAKNVMRSLRATARRGFIIYNGPLWGDAVEEQGFFRCRDFNAGECVVYSNIPDKTNSLRIRRTAAA
jgi:SAM-dependent methyltransferase